MASNPVLFHGVAGNAAILIAELPPCPGRPLMHPEGVQRRLEDRAAIDDAQRVIHAQPKPLQHRGECQESIA
jgi:hypothetical protein